MQLRGTLQHGLETLEPEGNGVSPTHLWPLPLPRMNKSASPGLHAVIHKVKTEAILIPPQRSSILGLVRLARARDMNMREHDHEEDFARRVVTCYVAWFLQTCGIRRITEM